MTAVAFDTLKFSRALREKAKLTSEQADGFAEAIAETIQNDLATKADIDALRLATKADIDAFRLATKADIDALRGSTKADIETLRVSTKADIETLRLSTKADVDGLRLTMKAEIETAKADTIKWVLSAIGFQTIVIVGAIVALARVFQS